MIMIGMAAARAETMRVGNLGQMLAYARTVRRAYEETGEVAEHEIALPGLAAAESQVAVPAMVLGQLVGVVAIESNDRLAFGPRDEALLTVVATMVASAIELDRAEKPSAIPAGRAHPPSTSTPASPSRVRFFEVDGSTFLDGEYLIKGVAGRILWVLLGEYVRTGREEFTNKEVRLDPSLELPEFRDNLESRLILLKRRLDERDAPIRIEKTGRGRFRLAVDGALQLDAVAHGA
jgi:adenylate cyclase